MVNSLLVAAAMIAPPAPAEAKIIGASLFKNGYAVVMRETPITGDETFISQIPAASLGTLWITAEGATIQEIKNTQIKASTEVEAANLNEILVASVGKQLVLTIYGPAEVSGTLLSAAGEVVVMQIGEELKAIPKAQIQAIRSKAGEMIYKIKRETTTRALQIKTTGGRGRLLMLSLERGMTWAPSYMIDISDKAKLKIVSKAIVLNDLANIKNVDLRLVTGFPNLAFMSIPDPLASGITVDQFVGMLMNVGNMAQDRFSNAMTSQAAERGRREMVADFMQAPTNPDVSTNEDLTFYNLKNITLEAADRGYYPLFQADSAYEHLYTWDLLDTFVNERQGSPPPVPEDLWHTLKFANSSKLAWTTGPVTTMKDGEILGQDLMRYAPVGAEVVVRITKALDIRGEQLEEEIGRERDALKTRYGTTYDLVTVKCTLSLSNLKSEAVKVRTTKEFTGELVSAEGDPKVMKTAKGLRDVNPRVKLQWTETVPARGTLVRTYTYKLYVNN